MLGDLDICK